MPPVTVDQRRGDMIDRYGAHFGEGGVHLDAYPDRIAGWAAGGVVAA